MNTSLTAAAAGLLSLAFASQAAAADAKSNPAAAEFTKMDANHDHLVSANEHAAGARQMFEAMDANKDGKVTADEMQAAAQRVTGHKAKVSDMSAADKIKAVDTDGDGVLTAIEHAEGSRTMFVKMDSNKDGLLTQAELTAGHARMLTKKAPR